MTETRPTNMRLTDETKQRLGSIKKKLKIPNNTKAVEHCIRIVDELLRINKSGSILLLNENGEKERLIVRY